MVLIKLFLQRLVGTILFSTIAVLCAIGVYRLASHHLPTPDASVFTPSSGLNNLPALHHVFHIPLKALYNPQKRFFKQNAPLFLIEHLLNSEKCFIQKITYLKWNTEGVEIALPETHNYNFSRLRLYAEMQNKKTTFEITDQAAIQTSNFLPSCEKWFFIHAANAQAKPVNHDFNQVTIHSCRTLKGNLLGIQVGCKTLNHCPILIKHNEVEQTSTQLCGVFAGTAWIRPWSKDGRPGQVLWWQVKPLIQETVVSKINPDTKQKIKNRSYPHRPYLISGWK